MRGVGSGALLAARARELRAQAKATLARFARRAALLLVGAVLLALGLAFLLAATYLQLSDWLGPKAAALVLAVVLSVVGLLLWYAARVNTAKPPLAELPPSSAGEQLGQISSSVQALRRDVTKFTNDNPALLIAGAFLLGLLSGRRKRPNGD
jgi:hypothetical protein